MTLSLKNTIATLALLVAIFILNGCGALNSLADDAKDALDDLNLDSIDGFSDLSKDDPCLKGNALFTSESCNGDTNRLAYNNLREASCIQNNNFRCPATITRICVTEERLNNVLCIGALYDLLRTQRDDRLEAQRQSVVIADWTDGTNEDGLVDRLNTEPNRAHTGNQFLSGLHDLGALPTSDQVQGNEVVTSDIKAGTFTVSNRSDRGTLTLAYTQEQRGPTHPVFNGFRGIDKNGDETDIGDALDGVVFVSGLYTQQTGCEGDLCSINRHYAGLLPTTDLGSPLTETLAQGTWHGWIQTRGDVTYNQRFDLTITFDESTDGGTIDAYIENVEDTTTALKIDGVFNNHGFVTGDILHGDIAPDNQIGDNNQSPGQLRGLIGDEGAVVAFISDATGPRTDDAPVQYSGGFVAYLPNSGSTATSTAIPSSADSCVKDYTCVDYAHWAASTTASPTDAPRPDRFLKGTVSGLAGVDLGDVAGSSSLANLNPPGDAKDGFAFYLPDATGSVHNVGIYSTTRLGAPLPNTIKSAQWSGRLYYRAGTDAITASPITLTVGFSTGSGSGTINGKNGVNREGLYEIVASYNDRGVIHGTIVRTAQSGDAITGANTGAISGLIGAEGVVGVFRNHASSSVSFVGGFLALPPPIVDYADWVAVANPTDTPTPNQFLKGTANGLMGVERTETSGISGITNTLANVHNHASTHILNAGDAGDGFAVYRVKDGAAHNAGILSGTDLGAPLTDTIKNVQWPGSLLARVGTGDTLPSLITLNVSFDGTDGTIAGSNSLSNFAILARFNNLGVITGDVTHTQRLPNSVLTGGSGSVTGLIGVDGAVAVFRNLPNSRTNYVGGFVAQPSQGIPANPCIAQKTCVDYAHWVAAENPTDTPMPNQFLKGTANGLMGVPPLDVAHLDLEDNTNNYAGLSGGDAKDGFGIYRPFNPHSSGSPYNVGIYSTTRLGAPLRGTFTGASWAGLLQDRVGPGNSVNSMGITLSVGFDAGTSAGTITYGNAGTTYEIDATFDAVGVISGDITRRVTTPTADTSTGIISGLIGAEGAVGVFRSNVGQSTSYVGGFVASPPAPNG